MARKKLHREPVLKDWAEVNDALRSIHEYEHALTEMGVDMSRRIDAVKAEYTKSAEPLQKRVKQLETDVQEYVEAHREDMAGKSRRGIVREKTEQIRRAPLDGQCTLFDV